MRFFLSIFIATFALTVNAKGPKNLPVEVVNSISEKSFFESELAPILRAIDTDNVTVYDNNCNYTSYVQTRDLATARVNGQDYYVVLNPSIINGVTYSSSHCEKTILTDGSSEVDCVANELRPAVIPGRTQPFSMKYKKQSQNPVHYLIYKCPWAGQ